MEVTLDYKTLCLIKDFNSFNSINSLSAYSQKEMSEVLLLLAYTDFLKAQGIVPQSFTVNILKK